MYYSSGNYETFARPRNQRTRRPQVGLPRQHQAGLPHANLLSGAGWSDEKGEHVHLFEKGAIPGGACDSYQYPGIGYVMQGGREWTRSFQSYGACSAPIPSIETEASVCWMSTG